MKVLWLTNIILPGIAKRVGEPFGASGGWLDNMSERLMSETKTRFICLSPGKKNTSTSKSNQQFSHYTFCETKCYDDFLRIIGDEKPDLIHIWGTEYLHSVEMVRACHALQMSSKVVIGIQGLVSIYSQHYYAYLPWKIVYGFSLRDLIRANNIALGKHEFERRGKDEIAAIKGVNHIIGRTDWDKACTEQINPSSRYHFCNESLRDEFYKSEWDIANVARFSIFVSQSGYPIKGFHLVLEAMPSILKKHPHAHLYTTGRDILNPSVRERLLATHYQRYLIQLIREHKLEGHVTFLGSLDEAQMCARYLQTHVFVSASSIENSSNSVGEAMILGVPTICSDVGGIKNLMEHGKEGFIYPADEPYMIAYYACRIFESDDLALSLSENARFHAKITHDRDANYSSLKEIYTQIEGLNRI